MSFRIILDTSVYDYFLENEEVYLLLKDNPKFVIYGNKIVRDELRAIPKSAKHKEKNLRNLLLNIFDKLVKSHLLELTDLTNSLAWDYFKEYTGNISSSKIFSDFLIIANASLNNLDIVVSEDRKTMLSKISIDAYKKVNKRNGLSTPKFYSIKELEKLSKT